MAVDVGMLLRDDAQNGLFRVRRTAFTSRDLLEREREAIFSRSWLYVGHHSEVKSVGDYVTRNVGGRGVIMVRASAEHVNVFFNACAHRGNRICRERKGNDGPRLFCFYHAWTYGLDGALLGVPMDDSYTPSFDRSELGLRQPARVETYRGLVFLNYSKDGPDLQNFLGNAREYLDLVLDFTAGELEIVPDGQRYSMRANWKMLLENSIDAYHAFAVHQRYFGKFVRESGAGKGDELRSALAGPGGGRGIQLENGHSVLESPSFALPLSESGNAELADVRRSIEKKWGEERARRILDVARNLFIFPNLILISNWKTIRTFYPASSDMVEVDSWALMPTGESTSLRAARLSNFASFLGPAGFGTPDDVEALEACQHGFESDPEAWSDVSRGMGREQPTASDELQMRAFWREWASRLSGKTAAANTDRNRA